MWKVSYISVVRVVLSIAHRYPKEAYGEERARTVIFERLSWPLGETKELIVMGK